MSASATNAARGSALLVTVVLGFALFAMIAAALTTTARLQQAGEHNEEVAQHAATWGVRYGDLEAATRLAETLAPDSTVTVTRLRSELTVEIVVNVPLLGPLRGLSYTIRSSATARASPYRSRP